MQKYLAEELLRKHKFGTLSEHERQALDEWILFNYPKDFDLTDEELEKETAFLDRQFMPPRKLKLFYWVSATAAAVLLICFGLGYYLYSDLNETQKALSKQKNIVPGSNKAVLTLANGKQINLSANIGEWKDGNKVSMTNSANGVLAYNTESGYVDKDVEMNQVFIPKGGQYQLILADGTKVFLNSNSSLKYPVAFNGNKRIVELSGEAYFEVAHQAKKTFEVHFKGQEVQVLGTHFNISAYNDEQSVTTLLQGSVKINVNGQQALLKPGEQALYNAESLKVSKVDTESSVAWKNGYFQFEDEKIQSIMAKLSRWYNVEVSYATSIPTEGFYGKISRYKNINDVLHVLEITQGVHFKIKGREVMVMK